jgi:hypothetical protein
MRPKRLERLVKPVRVVKVVKPVMVVPLVIKMMGNIDDEDDEFELASMS